jgi:hypothetical protein
MPKQIVFRDFQMAAGDEIQNTPETPSEKGAEGAAEGATEKFRAEISPRETVPTSDSSVKPPEQSGFKPASEIGDQSTKWANDSTSPKLQKEAQNFAGKFDSAKMKIAGNIPL